jgi:hypothetical protein
MAGSSRQPQAGDEANGDSGDATTGAPRWVKVFGIAVVVVILLMVSVMLISGGDHGPGRHMSGAGQEKGQVADAAPGGVRG